jgi:hypothetical protein
MALPIDACSDVIAASSNGKNHNGMSERRGGQRRTCQRGGGAVTYKEIEYKEIDGIGQPGGRRDMLIRAGMKRMTGSRAVLAAVAVLLITGAVPALAQERGRYRDAENDGGLAESDSAPSRPPLPRTFGSIRTRSVASSRSGSSEYGPDAGRLASRSLAPRRGGIRLITYYRPYYVFRPRLTLSTGFWIGNPVVYPSFYPSYVSLREVPDASALYGDAYRYRSPVSPLSSEASPRSLRPRRSGSTASSEAGVSFEIKPPIAGIFVDGLFAGTVQEFTPTTHPLDLTRGRHRIEVRAPGYQTVAMEADLIGGQVIPYRGELQR